MNTRLKLCAAVLTLVPMLAIPCVSGQPRTQDMRPTPPSGPATFKMTWQAGGAGRRENMNVGSQRVYEIELRESPPQGAEDLAAPVTRYGVAQFADESHASFVCGLRKPPAGTTGHESFFIDLNHSGALEEGEVLPPTPVFKGLTALDFGAVDLPLRGATGPYKHRVWVHTNTPGTNAAAMGLSLGALAGFDGPRTYGPPGGTYVGRTERTTPVRKRRSMP